MSTSHQLLVSMSYVFGQDVASNKVVKALLILLVPSLGKETECFLILNLKPTQTMYEIILLRGYGTATYKSACFRMALVH